MRITYALIASCLVGALGPIHCVQAQAPPRELRAEQTLRFTSPDDRYGVNEPVNNCIAISGDRTWLATGGDDHVVRLWKTESGEQVRRFKGHVDWIRDVAFQPGGKLLASAGDDRRVRFWDIETCELAGQWSLHDQPIYALAFSPDGRWLATVGFEQKVRIYDVATGDVAQELEAPCGDNRSVAFSNRGDLLAVAGRCGIVRIYRSADGTKLHDLPTEKDRVRALAFSADDARLAAAGEGRKLYIFDVPAGRQLAALPCRPGRVMSLAWCGGRLATGQTDNLIRVWDLEAGRPELSLVGHEGTVAALVYDETAETIVSGSFDTSLRMWRLGNGGDALRQDLRMPVRQ